jgi:hypothetical protein
MLGLSILVLLSLLKVSLSYVRKQVGLPEVTLQLCKYLGKGSIWYVVAFDDLILIGLLLES